MFDTLSIAEEGKTYWFSLLMLEEQFSGSLGTRPREANGQFAALWG
jgi:hypothetical protein